MGLLTVSSVTHSARAPWDTRQLRNMPTDQRRKSNDSFDAIDPDFPPPSLKQPENSRDREKTKKKDKKWSIGGFFRRKKKVSDTESSSSIEDGEEKKGFLERRRAARKRRNRGSKDVTGSFEHVRIAPQNNQNVDSSDHPRFRELVEERLVGRSHETLTKRQSDSFMRGSSVSLEAAGKKGGRIQVKARVEANRDMLRVDSSSDEGGSSRHSTSSMQRSKGEDTGSKEGSLSRRSRAARTERYKKRLSRDEDHMKDFQTNPSSRISRSDERLTNKSKSHERVPSNSRWTAKVVYCESSDYETKYTAKTKSATPSPLQSPKVRPKNALHYTSSAPPSSNYVTFPPSHAREGVAGSYQELRSKNFPVSHPAQKVNPMYSDITPPRLPKSSSELITNTPVPKSSKREQEVLNRKSASYDCNVNHLHYRNKHGPGENIVVAGLQFPISRPIQKVEAKIHHFGVSPPKSVSKHQNPPPPPPRDPHRRLVATNGHQGEGSGRPMSYAFEDRNQNQKYPGFSEFGSSVSAFHRVPQSSQTDLQSDPQMNKHHRSSSDHHLPGKMNSVKLSPPMARRSSSAQQDAIIRPQHVNSDTAPSNLTQNNMSQHYHYYTDQQPRSRKPIHIAYQNQKSVPETNDPQKPPVQQSPRPRPSGVQNAADFWKQKDQETSKKVHLTEGSPKLIQRHLLNINASNERSRSNSPFNEISNVQQKLKLAPLIMPTRGDSSGSLSNQSSPRDISSPRTPTIRNLSHNEIGIPILDTAEVPVREYRPLSMLEENTETSERESSPIKEKLSPPRPPERRDSKVNAVTNFEHFDMFSDNDLNDCRRKSGNLEDALNELEAIYKSLRLGEDAYLEKVSKDKVLCENNRLDPSNWNDWVKSRGFESDSSFNYSRSSMESVDSIDSPIKRPGGSVPDKVTDDMAYRRLNKKDKPPSHEQEVVSQAGSFLLVSPTLSPPPFLKFPPPPPVKNEPDITLDDVVYRNIKHTNNALKVLDPQPLFGIPLGPITPAPNSDYLHATPKETFRPTFKPRKTPDVVADDLAFRNLRKDNNKEPLFSPEDTTLIDSPVLKKKRAVRSLSANLLSIIHKESMAMKNNNNLIYNNNSSHIDLEKSQSFSDVPDAVSNNVSLNGLKSYRKLNELKVQSSEDSDATPRASRHYSTGTSSPLMTTSTETLTGSKVTLVPHESQQSSFYPKVSRTSSPRHASERRHTTDVINPFTRKSDSPIRHVPVKIEPLKINLPFENKQVKSNAQRSPTPDSHSFTHKKDRMQKKSDVTFDQTESDLLAALAREAKEASEQLSKELNELNFDKNIKPIRKIEKEDNIGKIQETKEFNQVKENLVLPMALKPLTIGKIVPHKPVKLNTFNITDDNKLENKHTIVTDKPIEIEGSKSMTDLLKELTKSLDFDFGPPKEEKKETSRTPEIEQIVQEQVREALYDQNDTNEETSSDIRINKTDPEETFFSSTDQIPDESSSSPEMLVPQSELTHEEKEEQTNAISLPLTLPEDDISLLQSLTEFTSAENEDQTNSISPFPLVLPEDQPISSSKGSQINPPSSDDHTYDLTEEPSQQSKEPSNEATFAKDIPPLDTSSPRMRPEKECRSPLLESRISRDSTAQGCSLDCTPVADEEEHGEQCPREDMVATLQSPQPTECMDTDAARRQRIAKYKEERRRQLAAQYGSHDVNSSSSGSGGASVTIRSTRASRLRSQAASAEAGKTSPLTRRDSVTSEKKEVNGRLGLASPEISKEKSPLSDTSSTSSLRKDRDKSAKRKSNLNRSLNNEPVTARDSPEDALRRRRVNGVTASPAKSSARSTPTTSTAPESDSPRSAAGRSFKRSTPPRESPKPRPRSSSALLERKSSASPSPAEPPSTPIVNGTDTPPATPPSAVDPCLPDVVRPSSILKKKSLDETSSQTHISQVVTNTAKPVSILKRKTSQEEGAAAVVSQPVTFSPTVLETSSRRQGILKKHCSLDEGSSGIGGLSLKQQRRKSLEEVRRHSSPEPQGILKRKTSREQGVESSGTNEPQGILKRKSSTGSSAPVHVTIADSVILAVAGEDSLLGEDHVKPILKKKSSVCEEPPGILQDSSAQSNDPLRPILKKKSSSETEESDEKPKRPILKSRKVSEGRISFTDHEATDQVPSQNVPAVEHSGIVENFQSAEDVVCRRYSEDVPHRKNEERRHEASSSPLASEDSPSALSKRAESLSPERPRVVRRAQKSVDPDIALKRRSLDSCVRFEEKPSSAPRVRASFSVAERVMNMEAFLATEAERPRSLSPSGLWEGKGAVPKRARDRERFRTQPITVEELSFSRSWLREEGEMKAATSRSDLPQEEEEEMRQPAPLSRSDSVSARASLFEAQLKRTEEEAKPRRVLRGSAARRVKLDPSRFQTQPVTQDEVEEAKRVNEATNNSSSAAEEDDPSKLSLAERVKLFNQKMVAERLAPKQVQPSRANRFKTQPVTTEEVETAKKITPISRTASSILVSGILKNLTEKNEGPKAKIKVRDTSESEDDMESVPSSPQKRGILKSPSQGLRNSISEVSESETTNLRSVLKKENKKTSEVEKNSKDLHSILKVTKKGEESSSEETETDSEEDKPNANSDLIDLLHKVEAQARGERKSNSPERRKSLQTTQNNKKPDELKNLKNLEQGKENYNLTRRLRRRKEGEFSEGDSSSSGGREVRKIINNEAVARRRQAGMAREAAERVKRYSADGSLAKSQSHSAMNGEVVLRPASMVEANPLRRCRTQPMDECDEPLTNGVSIAQRLEALQKRGQTDWKKRISRLNPEEELTTTNNINAAAQILQERLSTPVRSSPESVPSTPLDERLGLLESSTQGWKKRVAPSDATQFSVAGKMAASQVPLSPLLSPALERKKKTPKPERFRSKNTTAKKEVQSVPTSPEQEATQGVFKRSISVPGIEDKKNTSSAAEEVTGPLVSVPQAYDEHFSEFFTTSATQERLELRDEDLDNITSETSQLSVVRRTVKVNRRRGASSNPVKALAARTDLRTEYVEVKSGVAQREEKRINIERLAKNSNLAVEALAGLASQEDFAAVQLRSATSAPTAHLSTMLPYKELMLLQVKGRRHVQTRVVRPHYTSVNQGDCYVLVTPSQVFHWIGECSNVIEQSRSSEISQHIVQTRDLGCTATKVTTLHGLVPHKQFWTLLGADETTAQSFTGVEAGHPDEDEIYEQTLTDTNMIYEVEDEELVPREDYWGAIPKIEILDHNKVLVFDFGSELYVWMGKNVALDRRRTALRLGQEKWNQGFNYTDCDICPVTQAQYLGTRTETENQEKCGSERPDWALLAKITQHMETILFREKFLDWPDFSRVIQVKSRNQEKQVDGSVDVKPCEAQPMVDWTPAEPDLELEGSHLGRGLNYYDSETHRHFEIATTGLTVWHVQEFDSTEMEGSSIGQFHSGDSYVVRWCYTVTVTGRELTGAPSRHSTMGRDRCAYFTWQGRDATTNDKGAAALLTVQLDQERGPQLRLSQGQEYPAFRQLFNSGFVIHSGRRSDGFNQNCRWKLFMVLGEEAVEAMLVEVKCSIRQLRSRACLLLLDTRESCAYLWRGSHAHENTYQAALASVDRLKKHLPEEMGVESEKSLKVEEIEEGKEPKIFFEALGGHSRHLYTSLQGVSSPVTHTPRLFRFSSVSGEFTASPISPVCHHTDSPTPFPYSQHELYSARQPALFLLDAGDALWLWQGWWEEDKSEDSDDNSANTSSRDGELRWQAERRASMSTTLEYARLRGVTQPAQLVWAGLEPLTFTNLFPIWSDRDDIAQLNISDGRKPGEVLMVQEELARLTRSTYPLAQLLQRPLPEGVDPTRLEVYLAPHHFQELLGLTKEEFSTLPSWKQNKIKQEKGLF